MRFADVAHNDQLCGDLVDVTLFAIFDRHFVSDVVADGFALCC